MTCKVLLTRELHVTPGAFMTLHSVPQLLFMFFQSREVRRRVAPEECFPASSGSSKNIILNFSRVQRVRISTFRAERECKVALGFSGPVSFRKCFGLVDDDETPGLPEHLHQGSRKRSRLPRGSNHTTRHSRNHRSLRLAEAADGGAGIMNEDSARSSCA